MKEKRCSIIPWGILVFVSVLLVEVNADTAAETTTDGFIVDEANTMGHIPKKQEQEVKAVVRSMAMSLTPHEDKTSPASNTDKHLTTSKKDKLTKHIEPPINLEKSLQNLDQASKRTNLLASENSSKMKHNKTQVRVTNGAIDEKKKQERKSASPNVLTNSTIIGFLSKDPKYTIDSVGEPQEVKKKDKKDGEEEDTKKKGPTGDIAAIKSRKISDTARVNSRVKNGNITARDTVAKINGDNHIRVFKGDEDEKAFTARQKVEANSKGDKNNIEHNNLKKDVKSTVSSTGGKIHVATEDDFVKLRYVKKEIEENAVKKEVSLWLLKFIQLLTNAVF